MQWSRLSPESSEKVSSRPGVANGQRCGGYVNPWPPLIATCWVFTRVMLEDVRISSSSKFCCVRFSRSSAWCRLSPFRGLYDGFQLGKGLVGKISDPFVYCCPSSRGIIFMLCSLVTL